MQAMEEDEIAMDELKMPGDIDEMEGEEEYGQEEGEEEM